MMIIITPNKNYNHNKNNNNDDNNDDNDWLYALPKDTLWCECDMFEYIENHVWISYGFKRY